MKINQMRDFFYIMTRLDQIEKSGAWGITNKRDRDLITGSHVNDPTSFAMTTVAVEALAPLVGLKHHSILNASNFFFRELNNKTGCVSHDENKDVVCPRCTAEALSCIISVNKEDLREKEEVADRVLEVTAKALRGLLNKKSTFSWGINDSKVGDPLSTAYVTNALEVILQLPDPLLYAILEEVSSTRKDIENDIHKALDWLCDQREKDPSRKFLWSFDGREDVLQSLMVLRKVWNPRWLSNTKYYFALVSTLNEISSLFYQFNGAVPSEINFGSTFRATCWLLLVYKRDYQRFSKRGQAALNILLNRLPMDLFHIAMTNLEIANTMDWIGGLAVTSSYGEEINSLPPNIDQLETIVRDLRKGLELPKFVNAQKEVTKALNEIPPNSAESIARRFFPSFGHTIIRSSFKHAKEKLISDLLRAPLSVAFNSYALDAAWAYRCTRDNKFTRLRPSFCFRIPELAHGSSDEERSACSRENIILGLFEGTGTIPSWVRIYDIKGRRFIHIIAETEKTNDGIGLGRTIWTNFKVDGTGYVIVVRLLRPLSVVDLECVFEICTELLRAVQGAVEALAIPLKAVPSVDLKELVRVFVRQQNRIRMLSEENANLRNELSSSCIILDAAENVPTFAHRLNDRIQVIQNFIGTYHDPITPQRDPKMYLTQIKHIQDVCSDLNRFSRFLRPLSINSMILVERSVGKCRERMRLLINRCRNYFPLDELIVSMAGADPILDDYRIIMPEDPWLQQKMDVDEHQAEENSWLVFDGIIENIFRNALRSMKNGCEDKPKLGIKMIYANKEGIDYIEIHILNNGSKIPETLISLMGKKPIASSSASGWGMGLRHASRLLNNTKVGGYLSFTNEGTVYGVRVIVGFRCLGKETFRTNGK